MKYPTSLTDVNIYRAKIADNRGFTLIEMVVVTAVFIVVLMITGNALKTILDKGTTTLRSDESNIEGVAGLEMLRHDLQQAGFGLFTDATSTPTYTEAAGAPYSTFNDANAIPRAIVTGNNLSTTGVLTNTDYLAIKGTSLGVSAVSQFWATLPDTGVPKRWGRDDFTNTTDKVIVIDQRYDNNKKKVVRRLVQVSTTNYGVSYSSTGAFTDLGGTNVSTTYTPATGNMYTLFGIDSGVATFQAPFNRTDYFINRDASTPESCSPAAGKLFKMVMNVSDGTFNQYPVLDCVADMQIILGWNTTAMPETNNEVEGYTGAGCVGFSGSSASGVTPGNFCADPVEVNKRLRMVMIYLLAQDGRRDPNFVNTNTNMVIGDSQLDPSGNLTKSVDLTTADFRNYRWKLYRVLVRPKNIF
jgi:prepilin-type N-terminal cleavage/methylation domain-containing protein